MRRAHRPAGERFGFGPRRHHRSAISPGRARNALAATATLSLAAADREALLRLWARRGGASREFADGSIELLAPNGERITRGTPAHIEDQLRLRLARVDLWPLLVA